MKAYEVILQLYEKGEDGDERSDSTVKIITIAPSLSIAADQAATLYEEADDTVEGFHWEAISTSEIKGAVALPKTNKILPKIE